MADSNITKKALASALRELMEETPFEKINVAQICEACGMNRKSFYYHFRDKYDLVNWIFDTDFITMAKKRPDDQWDFIEMICFYFYENRTFYRRVLKVKGQNSFLEHLHEFMHPLLYDRLKQIIGKEELHPICIDFFADALCCAVDRWLLGRDNIPPEQFAQILKSIVQKTAVYVCKEMEEESP